MSFKKSGVISGYNNCAKNYSENRDLFRNNKYLDSLADKLPTKAKILDIGCGSGVPIDKYLQSKNFEITGVDISEEMIRLAKENFPSGNYLVGDMEKIDFPASSFDAIVSFYAIFHTPRERHLKLLKKIRTLLVNSGYLLITMGASEWEGTENDFHGSKMYWSHYGREKNIQLVKKAGFEIIYETIDTSGDEKHLIIFAQKH